MAGGLIQDEKQKNGGQTTKFSRQAGYFLVLAGGLRVGGNSSLAPLFQALKNWGRRKQPRVGGYRFKTEFFSFDRKRMPGKYRDFARKHAAGKLGGVRGLDFFAGRGPQEYNVHG